VAFFALASLFLEAFEALKMRFCCRVFGARVPNARLEPSGMFLAQTLD